MSTMMKSNMIHRMNLFMSKGVRQAARSRKGSFYEEISPGIGTNQKDSPATSSMDTQLA
jgi:hypothetical protein